MNKWIENCLNGMANENMIIKVASSRSRATNWQLNPILNWEWNRKYGHTFMKSILEKEMSTTQSAMQKKNTKKC